MNETLDIAALLKPVKPDNPAGDAVAPYTDTYAAIEEAKRADPEGVRNPKKADWRDARKKAETALKEKGKDLYVACALIEALYHTEGAEGVAEGLRFLNELLNTYWANLYPPLAGEDEPERCARFEWLEGELSERIRSMPLTAPLGAGKAGYDLMHWQQAQSIEQLTQTDRKAAEAAIADGGVSSEMFKQASAATPAKVYLSLKPALDNFSAVLEELSTTTGKLLNGAGPSFDHLKDVLSDCRSALDTIMRNKGLIKDPPPQPREEYPDDEHEEDSEPGKKPKRRTGPVGSREEALRDLKRIAEFFRDTEPHSPVSYLIMRAEKWARMPLDTLLGELIGDVGVLENLKTLLNLQENSAEQEKTAE